MKLEWSDDALADLDRFAEFLNQRQPLLAARVAGEITAKTQILAEHPRLGRPIAGREEYRQLVCCRSSEPLIFFSIASTASAS